MLFMSLITEVSLKQPAQRVLRLLKLLKLKSEIRYMELLW